VRVVSDINGHSNVIRDGIDVAQRVMGLAAPNQILVSRSYYEVVSRLAPDYAQLLQYVGL
jgi:class 3 adenylate cyclase